MDFPRFRRLVVWLEPRASANPARIRAEAGGLIVLGYGYLALIIAGLVALIVLAAIEVYLTATARAGLIKIILALGTILLVALNAIWVRFVAPTGREVTQQEAPSLFALIERVRSATGGPPVDRVWLSTAVNASIIQHPRWGIFGHYENHLTIGLGLMRTLTRAEVEGVIAHEFGHLAGDHGRFGAWIYRQRVMWDQLATATSAGWFTRWLFAPLLRGIAPLINAYGFVLGRQQEYEADQLAVRVVGRDVARGMLLRIVVTSRWEDEHFWPGIDRAARAGEPPPEGLWLRFDRDSLGAVASADQAKWIAEALQTPTDYTDTHPGLADRLAAIGGENTAVPRPIESSAADEVLGPLAERWATELSVKFLQENAEGWKARAAEGARLRERQAELATRAAAATLTPQEELDIIEADEAATGPDGTRDRLLQHLERHPDHLPGRFALGRILLALEQDDGLDHLEHTIRGDRAALMPASQLAFRYLWSRGRKDEAEQWRERAHARDAELQAADAERANVSGTLKFAPHGLPPETIAQLQEMAARHAIKELYIARRTVKLAAEVPSWFVGFVPQVPWWKPAEGIAQRIQGALVQETVWPGDTRIVAVIGQNRRHRKKLRQLTGSQIVGT